MRISRSATYAMCVTAALALLAGCSGGGQQASSSLTPVTGQSAAAGGHGLGSMGRHNQMTFTSVHAPQHIQGGHHKSWVSPDVKRAPRLLFVSDDDYNEVFIFTMPAMAVKGVLSGFSEPQGMCSDKQGNIWVANTGTSQGLKYNRTGTLLATVSDPYGYPVGCAVNPTNGDLALTDIFDFSGAGGVVVYPGGSGSGTRYSNPSQYEYFFAAYNDDGDLYTDGFSYPSFVFTISELPAGSSSMHTVSYSGGTVYFPGGVNWDRVNYNLVVGDQECNGGSASCQYQMLENSSGGLTITGSTPLQDYNGGSCDVDQGALAPFSKYFAGGCISTGSALSAAARWSYPSGGTPTNYNDSYAPYMFPIGAAISNKRELTAEDSCAEPANPPACTCPAAACHPGSAPPPRLTASGSRDRMRSRCVLLAR